MHCFTCWPDDEVLRRCSVDPMLFDNFITTTGDYVSAKFRAFKFPETNYVLFRGTVDVCLDKCQGVSELLRGTNKGPVPQPNTVPL